MNEDSKTEYGEKCECDELRDKIRNKSELCRVCGSDAEAQIKALEEAREYKYATLGEAWNQDAMVELGLNTDSCAIGFISGFNAARELKEK